MTSAPQRSGRNITTSAPRRPLENGRKPIGRKPRDSAYRLSSRLLRSRPPRARSLSRSLSDLLRSSRLRSRSRSSESWTVSAPSRLSGIPGVHGPNGPPRRSAGKFVTIWLRASSADASSPFLMKSLTCLFSTLLVETDKRAELSPGSDPPPGSPQLAQPTAT